MAKNEKMFELRALVVKETPKAYLLDDGGREEWFPKSQVQDNGDGTFTIPMWLAIDKGVV
jgi:hypothetical protein